MDDRVTSYGLRVSGYVYFIIHRKDAKDAKFLKDKNCPLALYAHFFLLNSDSSSFTLGIFFFVFSFSLVPLSLFLVVYS